MSNGWTTHISNVESCTDKDYVAGMHDNVAAKISSRNFGKNGAGSPKTLVGQHGYYQPIRQWVVVENDDQGQSSVRRPYERRRQIGTGVHPLSAFGQGAGRAGPSAMTRSAN